MAKCPRCKNQSLEPRIIRYTQECEGKFYILEGVPAHICTTCDEIILSEATAERIQEIIWAGVAPDRTESVPVYQVSPATL